MFEMKCFLSCKASFHYFTDSHMAKKTKTKKNLEQASRLLTAEQRSIADYSPAVSRSAP